MGKTVVKIVIKGTSGFGPVSEAFHDKITLTADSIRYEYIPEIESEENPARKWSYKTTSTILQERFLQVCAAAGEIINTKEVPCCTDLGVTTFELTYDDKKKVIRSFVLPRDYFSKCFGIIKKMIPPTELVPAVL
ncbi:MAG: hypothetical protein IKR18_03340 [Bacteroidaceae bacterium]|nr:hypothetical protein [Bacteroidaceae bacterium]